MLSTVIAATGLPRGSASIFLKHHRRIKALNHDGRVPGAEVSPPPTRNLSPGSAAYFAATIFLRLSKPD
jgi:hypothetical protein